MDRHMKKIILLMLSVIILSCQEDSNTLPATNYTIEGKWIYPSDTQGISASGFSNTMYLYEDGIRYTYYCTDGTECESLYDSYQAGDGNHIPGTNNYTVENGVLTIDLNFGNVFVSPITFECEGGILSFQDPNSTERSDLIRLNSGCDL